MRGSVAVYNTVTGTIASTHRSMTLGQLALRRVNPLRTGSWILLRRLYTVTIKGKRRGIYASLRGDIRVEL